MGLFVREDGYYHGWLASMLCCCAAVGSDEHPAERLNTRPTTRENTFIVHEQPPSYNVRLYPLTPGSSLQSLRTHSSPHDSRLDVTKPWNTSSPPLKPLDFGPSSLFTRRFSEFPINPDLSASFDVYESPHRGLIPLRLAPVVLGNSDHLYQSPPTQVIGDAAEYTHERSGSGDALLPVAPPASYRLSRESPFQRLVRRSTDVLTTGHSQLYDGDTVVKTSSDQHVNIILSHKTSASSIQSSRATDETTSAPSRHSEEPQGQLATRLRRKHSAPTSLRLKGAVDVTPDTDAVELKTITEEQKIDSPIRLRISERRPGSSEPANHASPAQEVAPFLSEHVPAVAPSMQMHVRSETLNDIGSAFSRPVTARSDHKDFDDLLREQDDENNEEGTGHRRSRSAAQVAKIRSRSSSRVSGWLNSVRASHVVPVAMPDSEHIQRAISKDTTASPAPAAVDKKQRLRKHSNPSWSSTTTNQESHLITATSSPVSDGKSHSRSMTAESRLTSPASTVPAGEPSFMLHDRLHDTESPYLVDAMRTSAQRYCDEKEAVAVRSRDSTIAKTERICEEEGWLPINHQSQEQVGIAL